MLIVWSTVYLGTFFLRVVLLSRTLLTHHKNLMYLCMPPIAMTYAAQRAPQLYPQRPNSHKTKQSLWQFRGQLYNRTLRDPIVGCLLDG